MTLLTIRETAKMGPLSEKALRNLRQRRELPGVQVGNRFLVHYELLLKQLEARSKQEAKING